MKSRDYKQLFHNEKGRGELSAPRLPTLSPRVVFPWSMHGAGGHIFMSLCRVARIELMPRENVHFICIEMPSEIWPEWPSKWCPSCGDSRFLVSIAGHQIKPNRQTILTWNIHKISRGSFFLPPLPFPFQSSLPVDSPIRPVHPVIL